MGYKEVIKSIFNYNNDSELQFINNYITEDRMSDVNFKNFIKNEILNKIYNINNVNNVNNEKKQHNMICYLSYVIITLFTNHEHDISSIDTYDILDNQYINSDVNYEDNNNYNNIYQNNSKLVYMVKNIYNLGYLDIILNHNKLHYILSVLHLYANNEIEFMETLTKLFESLNYYQIVFLCLIKNTNNERIVHYLTCYDNENPLYFINGNFNNIQYNYVVSDNKENIINYLNGLYTPEEKLDYLSFGIKKIYCSDFGLSKSINVCLFNNQLQYLLKYITDRTMTVSERFDKYCNILSYNQLNYVGI